MKILQRLLSSCLVAIMSCIRYISESNMNMETQVYETGHNNYCCYSWTMVWGL